MVFSYANHDGRNIIQPLCKTHQDIKKYKYKHLLRLLFLLLVFSYDISKKTKEP